MFGRRGACANWRMPRYPRQANCLKVLDHGNSPPGPIFIPHHGRGWPTIRKRPCSGRDPESGLLPPNRSGIQLRKMVLPDADQRVTHVASGRSWQTNHRTMAKEGHEGERTNSVTTDAARGDSSWRIGGRCANKKSRGSPFGPPQLQSGYVEAVRSLQCNPARSLPPRRKLDARTFCLVLRVSRQRDLARVQYTYTRVG
jgi:hypothetical protein